MQFLGEAGEDGGGPRREFWALLSREIGSSVFEGLGNLRVLLHDAVGLQVSVRYITSVPYMCCEVALVVIEEEVLLHGPADGHEFSPRREWISLHGSSSVEYLCSVELSSIDVTVDDVPNPEVKDLIEQVYTSTRIFITCLQICNEIHSHFPFPHQIDNAPDEPSLRKVCLKEVDVILESGYTLPVTCIGMGGKSELLRILMLHHALLRSKAGLDQLRLGLSALGVLDVMSKYPAILEPYFVAGKQPPLTAGNAFFSEDISTIQIKDF